MAFNESELRLLRAAAGEDGDLAAINAALGELSHVRNTTPLDDFAGLTPTEMSLFLYQPFDTPEYIQLPEVLSIEPAAPILELLMPLFEELGKGPMKLTAKGNLPTAYVKARAAEYAPQYYSFKELAAKFAYNEDSFMDLHVARIVSDLAGLVRKQHGKLLLTKKTEKLLAKHGARGLYPELLRAYLGKFNWAYVDEYEELPFIQQSWAFTCYLLQHFGPAERPAAFYSERFLQAFPRLVGEVEARPYREPEETVRHAYELRALERFLGLFGLATFSWEMVPQSMPRASVSPTALMMDAIQLQVR